MDVLAGYGSSDEEGISFQEGVNGGGGVSLCDENLAEVGTKRRASDADLEDAMSLGHPRKCDDDRHQGRVRSFPHVDGNYAGFVFIEVGGEERREVLSAAAQAFGWADEALAPRDVIRIPNEELHLTLSRTFAIRLVQIKKLVRALQENVSRERAFAAVLCGASLYSNDENTRTFAGLRLRTGDASARALVRAVDNALGQFSLQPYYENPSIHVSVAWSLGGLPDPTPQQPVDPPPHEAAIWLQKVQAKIGAKTYEFHLKGGA